MTSDPNSATSTRRHPVAANDHHWRHPLLVLVPVVVISLIALAINRIEPDQPGPFYTVSSAVTGAPGTIIRTEAIPTAPAGAQAWRILYVSTGLEGQPIAVSGSVFVPDTVATSPGGGTTPPGSAPRPVVAWAHPTTGVASRCAPSLATDGGASAIPGLASLLTAGYIVTATDYPGLGTAGPHPYLVGPSEAMAVIDSVRAATQLPGTNAGTTFAVWGHSQGGHASLFTGQLAPTYAPELTLAGVATAAPATELAELLEHDVPGVVGNVLASMAVVSWSQVYAGQGLSADQVLQPTAIPVAQLIADYCIESTAQVMIDLPEAAIEEKDFLSTPPWVQPAWAATLHQNTPGAVVIRVPVLVNQGTADTVVWPGITADWVGQQCAANVIVAEVLYDGVTHTTIAKDSAADAVTWISARFAGAPATSTCATGAVPAPAPAAAPTPAPGQPSAPS